MRQILIAAAILLGLIGVFAGVCIAENPPQFALHSEVAFIAHSNFHGGAGTIEYAEYFGPDDYQSQHHFLRVVNIPPRASIGEYRLTDSDETFALFDGRAYVTVDGRTGHLAGMTLVPVNRGSTIGIFNPTDEPITIIWACSVMEKGSYHPEDTGNDLTEARPENVIPFRYIAQNYHIADPVGRPSHLGLGQGLIENVELIDFGYFETGYHTRWFAVPPHSSIGYHTHFTNEEHFFVVKGSARGTVNDVTVRMGPLDCLMCGVDDTHGIYNDGDENLWLFFTNQPMPGVTGWGKLDNNGDSLGDHEVNWSPGH